MLNEFLRQLTGIDVKPTKQPKKQTGRKPSPGLEAVTETNKAFVDMLKSAHKK